jgi:dihydrofolate reductase
VFVIGGDSVYLAMYPHLSRVFVTKIDMAPHSEAFFPNLDMDAGWRCTDAGELLVSGGVGYRFCVYERV